MSYCPFDDPNFSLGREVPCPVCGDLATGSGADGIGRCRNTHRTCVEQAATLRARVAELEAVLRDNEWVLDNEMDYLYCPECFGTRRAGHEPDCRLSAAINPKETT